MLHRPASEGGLTDRMIRSGLNLFGLAGDESDLELRRKLVRMAPPAMAIALAASLLFHVIGWLVASLITVPTAQAGGAGAPLSEVEFAVVTESELAALEQAALELEPPPIPDMPVTELPSVDLVDTQLSDAVSGMINEVSDVGAALGAGDVSGSSGLSVSGGGGGAASFFGVEARGRRFAYIVDTSGSMGVGGKIDALKRELAKSVDALLENAFYLVVQFNSDASPLGGRREWMEASDAGKSWGRKSVAQLGAAGGTEPAPGFVIIFGMKPKPDAIYFMTDGEFDPQVIAQISALNADYRVPIHCITFVNRDGEALMRRIAEDSGGTYTHVPGAGG